MHCAADDNDYSDNDIICISFTASAFKRQDTIDDYLEDLRNEPEHKRKKGELE